MADTVLSASAAHAGIAVSAAITTSLVAEIRDRHDLWPTATAAVGRLVTGAVLLGANLKGNERISMQIAGDGPLGAVAADAWLLGDGSLGARGYVRNGQVELPINTRGKFDVAAAIGAGSLQVTRSFDVGQPYVGVVRIHSGEIAEDLAVYLAQSEQIPSIVALGVLANPSGVLAAGGILAQVLPGADERALTELEKRALALPPVTQLIAEHADAEALMHALAGDLELRSQRSIPVRFACRCDVAKVEAALLGLGADELRRLAHEERQAEATCEFCKRRYVLTLPEIESLLARL